MGALMTVFEEENLGLRSNAPRPKLPAKGLLARVFAEGRLSFFARCGGMQQRSGAVVSVLGS